MNANEWRPIATAPKDGTWVETRSEGCDDIGRWQEERYCILGAPQGSYGPGFVDQETGLPMSGEFEPTHWRPLTPPHIDDFGATVA